MMKHLQRGIALLLALGMSVSFVACSKGGGKDTSSGETGSVVSVENEESTSTDGEATSDVLSGETSDIASEDGTGTSTNDGTNTTSSKKSSTTSKTNTNTSTPTINRGNYNLGGKTIKVIGWGENIEPKLGNNAMGDAYYYAKKYVEEKYNCKIQYQYKFSGDSYNTQILTAALSQKAFADLMQVHVLNYIDWIKRGMLVDVTDKIQKAPDAKQWKQEISMYKDKLYGLNETPRRTLHGSMLLYNTTLLKKLNLESPQKLYNNNQWDFNKLLEYCKKAVTLKGVTGIASFGLDSAVMISTGAQSMYVKSGNKYYNAYTHSSTRAKVEKALNMLKEMKPYMLGDVCQDMPAKLEAIDSFTQNKTLFIYTGSEQAKSFKEQGEKNFAPVPFPLNGASHWENAETYFAFTGINAFSTIDKDALAAIQMDLRTIWDPGRGKAYYEENEKDWATSLYEEFYLTKSDADFMINAGKKCTYKGYYWLNLGGTVTWDIVTPVLRGEKTPAQVLSATDSKIQATIDSVLNS